MRFKPISSVFEPLVYYVPNALNKREIFYNKVLKFTYKPKRQNWDIWQHFSGRTSFNWQWLVFLCYVVKSTSMQLLTCIKPISSIFEYLVHYVPNALIVRVIYLVAESWYLYAVIQQRNRSMVLLFPVTWVFLLTGEISLYESCYSSAPLPESE